MTANRVDALLLALLTGFVSITQGVARRIPPYFTVGPKYCPRMLARPAKPQYFCR